MTNPQVPLCVAPKATTREVLAAINANGKGIVAVCDEEGRLLNTISDGDVRRALLNGISLTDPASRILRKKEEGKQPHALTAPVQSSPTTLLRLMKERGLRQIVLVDQAERVTGIVHIDALIPQASSLVRAVVMAGGQGTRLRPLTESMPKPMIPVGDKPLLEHIIVQLRSAGIRNVNVTTHYLSETIVDHFGNGEKLGVSIQYINEDTPLGTAGALRKLAQTGEPILVVNGDVLTDLNYRALVEFHLESGADMTVGLHQYEVPVPYGIVDVADGRVRGLEEKPTLRFNVNAGIYLLQPHVLDAFQDQGRLEMTDVIEHLLRQGRPIASFPIHEFWIDIGRPADLERAQEKARAK